MNLYKISLVFALYVLTISTSLLAADKADKKVLDEDFKETLI